MPTTLSSICSGPRSAASTTLSVCGRLATSRPPRPLRRPQPDEVLVHIIARGKIGRSPEAELTDRYLKRIQWPTKVTELPDRGGDLPEAAGNAITVVLDERGKALSSTELAKRLEGWRDTGRRETRVLLAAADGHEE